MSLAQGRRKGPEVSTLRQFLSFEGGALDTSVAASLFALVVLGVLGGMMLEVAVGGGALFSKALLLLIVPSFARRMRDHHRSPWWAIVPTAAFVILPLVGPWIRLDPDPTGRGVALVLLAVLVLSSIALLKRPSPPRARPTSEGAVG